MFETTSTARTAYDMQWSRLIRTAPFFSQDVICQNCKYDRQYILVVYVVSKSAFKLLYEVVLEI